MSFLNHINSSGQFPVNFRTGKEVEFPLSGVPYIGTGNGRIICQQDMKDDGQ